MNFEIWISESPLAKFFFQNFKILLKFVPFKMDFMQLSVYSPAFAQQSLLNLKLKSKIISGQSPFTWNIFHILCLYTHLAYTRFYDEQNANLI